MTDDIQTLGQDWVKRKLNASLRRGKIGMPTGDGTYTIDVPGRAHWVYVRIGEEQNATIIQAINMGTSNEPNLPVFIDINADGDPYIIGPAGGLAASYLADAPMQAAGLHSHAIGYGMEDPVEARRVLPGLVTANTGLEVYIQPCHYRWNGTDYYFGGGAADLTSNIPSTANTWAWVKVGINPTSNAVITLTGTEYSVFTDLTVTELNAIGFSNYLPLAGVKLRNGQTEINDERDFLDCRLWCSGAGGSGGSDSGLFVGGPANTLTLASGAITVSGSYHIVTGASGDTDLDTIAGGSAGQLLVLVYHVSTYGVTLKHGTGNINTSDGYDVAMETYKAYFLVYDNSKWYLLNAPNRHIYVSSDTNTVKTPLTISHSTTGSPAAGHGAALTIGANTTASGTIYTVSTIGQLVGEWVDATGAFVGRLKLMTNDAYGPAEAIRAEGDSAGAAKLGFFGVAAAARPAAYTQTYSTASRTVNAYTTDDESGAYTGIDNTQAGTVYAQLTDLNALRTAYETLRASYDNALQVLNSVVDDLQALGLLQ